MRLLLDTHTFLWFAAGSSRLSPIARRHIEDPSHELLLSIASLWEMAIKISLDRLDLGEPMAEFVEKQVALNSIELLEISLRHVCITAELQFHHRDPFDRLLAAQCIVDDLDLVSADGVFEEYGVRRVW
ncbi:MAG: type II toxin-antitoxin system VapC family toxin [Phycisphaerae bacterium]|nr:type II toxin-antitoxin system VapC family toxin [Phycisphaerae bacterium]